MQKQIYLSVFLGLLFNTLFFAQTQIEVEVEETTSNGETEVTIERTVIDENGNETKYVIKKVGTDADELMSNEEIQKHMGRDFEKDHPDSRERKNIERRVYKYYSDDGQREQHLMNQDYSRTNPKVRMGIEFITVEEGIKITYVMGNSAAQNAGLQIGDIIQLMDNQPVKEQHELTDILKGKEVGDNMSVTVLRGEEEKTVFVKLKGKKLEVDHPENCGYVDKPCLGVYYRSWNDGIHITGTFSASGAEASGLAKDDKILKVDGKAYKLTSQFDRMIKSKKPGTFIDVEYERGGEVATVEAEVGIWNDCGICQLMSNLDDETIKQIQPILELKLGAFEMYPVPASDQITVSFVGKQAPIEVVMYDVNGKVIDREKIENFSGSFTKSYNLDQVAKGMALFTITQNGRSTTKQALIQ